MATFGQDFLNGFFGNDYLKDFKHASKTFRSAGYDLAPRFKFLYHVYFTLNTAQIPRLRTVFDTTKQPQLGFLCKTAQLPSYNIDVETLDQYNRKRNIQTKINYQPVRLVLHDDNSDLARKLWYNYYSYYYKDPSQKYNGVPTSNGTVGTTTTPTSFDYNERNIYKDNLAVNDWGYIGEAYSDSTTNTGGKPQFFRDITIYGFSRKEYFSYTLINPMITAWDHDTYDYSADGGTMENTITLAYETVKYGSGSIASGQVPGFGTSANYDTEKSPLMSPGGTESVLGPGGLLASGSSIFSDLQNGNFLGAAQGLGATYNSVKNMGGTRGVLNAAKGDLTGALLERATNGQLAEDIKSIGSSGSGIFTGTQQNTGSNTTVGTAVQSPPTNRNWTNPDRSSSGSVTG